MKEQLNKIAEKTLTLCDDAAAVGADDDIHTIMRVLMRLSDMAYSRRQACRSRLEGRINDALFDEETAEQRYQQVLERIRKVEEV